MQFCFLITVFYFESRPGDFPARVSLISMQVQTVFFDSSRRIAFAGMSTTLKLNYKKFLNGKFKMNF
jgi:hypothetical protein